MFPQPVSGNVILAKTTLDTDCGLEAQAIVSLPRPSNQELATAYDNVTAAYQNQVKPDDLRQQLDLFTVAAEDTKIPEPFNVYWARLTRMQAYSDYIDAKLQQTPTQDLRDEWQASQDALTAASKIPVASSDPSNVQLPGWMSPN